jgi:hypothetical protein
MPVKIIEETKEKQIAFLEDVDVEFVSLVRHGANQMPFRIIKEEKGGGMKDMMIVQRVLVAKHVDLKGVSRLEGAEWLADANLEKAADKGAYHVAEQADLDLFDQTTLKMVKVHDDGVWALVGAVKEGTDTKNMLALGAEHTKVAKEMQSPPMDAAIPMPAAMQTAVSFRELFFRELDSMLDVVVGTLNQSAGDTAKRKTVVLSAVDSFRSFLSIGLDALGGESAKIKKVEAKQTVKEESDMFKTIEEFTKAVKELVGPMIEEATKGIKDEIAKVAKPVETPPAAAPAPSPSPAPDTKTVDDAVKAVETKVMEAVSAVTAKVDDLVKKWDNAPVTDPAATTTPDPAPVQKGDKSSPFSGMLTRKQQAK